jgi:hypothetical protein
MMNDVKLTITGSTIDACVYRAMHDHNEIMFWFPISREGKSPA